MIKFLLTQRLKKAVEALTDCPVEEHVETYTYTLTCGDIEPFKVSCSQDTGDIQENQESFIEVKYLVMEMLFETVTEELLERPEKFEVWLDKNSPSLKLSE